MLEEMSPALNLAIGSSYIVLGQGTWLCTCRMLTIVQSMNLMDQTRVLVDGHP